MKSRQNPLRRLQHRPAANIGSCKKPKKEQKEINEPDFMNKF
jgi:hypothetical protein